MPTTWALWVAGSISWIAAVVRHGAAGAAARLAAEGEHVAAESDDGGISHGHRQGRHGREVGAVGRGQDRRLVGGAVVATHDVDGAPDGRGGEVRAGLWELAGHPAGTARGYRSRATARSRTCRASRPRIRTTSRRFVRPRRRGRHRRASPRPSPSRSQGRATDAASRELPDGGEAPEDAEPIPDGHQRLPGERGAELPGLDPGLEGRRPRGARPFPLHGVARGARRGGCARRRRAAPRGPGWRSTMRSSGASGVPPDESVTTRAATPRTNASSTTARRRRICIWRCRRLVRPACDVGSLTAPRPAPRPGSAIRRARP